jgi:polysaccharide biosynthesis protein PslA
MAAYEQQPIGPNKPAASLAAVAIGRSLSVTRGLDMIVAVVGLALFTPILLLTAAAIKLDSHGPIFVRETRFGSKNRRIKVLKFRFATAGAQGSYPRPTRVGMVLSDTGVAELPGLFSVLRGDLSIVATQD